MGSACFWKLYNNLAPIEPSTHLCLGKKIVSFCLFVLFSFVLWVAKLAPGFRATLAPYKKPVGKHGLFYFMNIVDPFMFVVVCLFLFFCHLRDFFVRNFQQCPFSILDTISCSWSKPQNFCLCKCLFL